MEEDEVTIEGQDLHHFSCSGLFDWFACLLSRLVLDDDCDSTNKGVKFLGANKEPLFHLGESFCVSLLSEVSLQSPFLPRLVLVHLG